MQNILKAVIFMNRLGALFPHKHVRFCESLLGLAGYILTLLNDPMTLDEIYSYLHSQKSGWYIQPDFTEIVLAVDILLCLKQVKLERMDRIRKVVL